MTTDKKISQLPAAAPLTGAELVPVVQDGVTAQTTIDAIANLGLGTVDPLAYYILAKA